ncbi:MAG: SPFH domain-containing protein [Fimbriimonadaceae bacterium]|nr:SPFH domain-containing protein [Fimbriimonadaceae bacterium]
MFVSFRIADPVRALLEHESWQLAMHAVVQVALREVVTGTTADEMLAARGTLGTQIAERVRPRFAELGLELEGSIDVRDITFPGDLKRAFAKVLLARKEGEAALERARGEQAALRSLANSARLIAEHPGLLHLRALQAAEQGATVVFGELPPGTAPG